MMFHRFIGLINELCTWASPYMAVSNVENLTGPYLLKINKNGIKWDMGIRMGGRFRDDFSSFYRPDL